MENNPPNAVFTAKSMDAFSNGEKFSSFEEAAERFLGIRSGASNGEVLAGLYGFMAKRYRNEFIFKDALFKRQLLGVHGLRSSAAACELPVNGPIADFALLSKDAVVYEIKTDLDGFSRLEGQVEDYYSAFRYVNVLCSEEHVGEAERLCRNWPVGVCALTRKASIGVRNKCRDNGDSKRRAFCPHQPPNRFSTCSSTSSITSPYPLSAAKGMNSLPRSSPARARWTPSSATRLAMSASTPSRYRLSSAESPGHVSALGSPAASHASSKLIFLPIVSPLRRAS